MLFVGLLCGDVCLTQSSIHSVQSFYLSMSKGDNAVVSVVSPATELHSP